MPTDLDARRLGQPLQFVQRLGRRRGRSGSITPTRTAASLATLSARFISYDFGVQFLLENGLEFLDLAADP